MSRILCLETATTNCSVALSNAGSVIAFREDNSPGYSHSEKLHVFIEEVLQEAEVSKDQLDAIAVSMGPGSYTGLRIGVSAAKGLCFAVDIPLIAVSTLEALALKVKDQVDCVVPLLDARRMEVYSAVFDRVGNQVRAIKAEIIDGNSFSEYFDKGKMALIGNGVAKFLELCEKEALFLPDELPSSLEMVSLAQEKFVQQSFEDVAYFEPYYLKDFIAG